MYICICIYICMCIYIYIYDYYYYIASRVACRLAAHGTKTRRCVRGRVARRVSFVIVCLV